ncbi:DUF6287 domain-containing protein [Streptococcus pneumoniae]
MKKQWMTKSAMVLVTASLLLGACGNKAEKASDASSSTAKVEQSSTKASSKASKMNEKSSSEMNQASEETQTSTSSQETTTSNNENQEATEKKETAAASAIDVNALINGDFSSIAGTWQNDKGETLVFSNDGLVSEDRQLLTNDVVAGRAHFTIAPKVVGEGGASGLLVMPTGVAAPGGTVYTQDAIVVAQSMSEEAHPYYKTN